MSNDFLNVDIKNLFSCIELIKASATTNFDSTLDVAVVLGINSKHSHENVRGVVSLPFGTGKEIRVAVICNDSKNKEAYDAGADIVGLDDLLSEIKSGVIRFDSCICTPDVVPLVQRQVARVLGPKGLMPNPNLGTVTFDIANAVKKVKSGRIEYRNDKAGIIHAGIGKLSFSVEHLVENFKSFMQALKMSRPSSVKEDSYIKKCCISSTMMKGSIMLDCSVF